MTNNECVPQRAMPSGDLFGSVVTGMVAVLTKPADFFRL